MKTALLEVLRFAIIAGAVCAAVYALTLARASALFQQDTAVSVAAAVHLQPHNATYLDRLASWQPEDRQRLLERSVAEDPFNFNAWIRLGLLAEMQDGDNARAERNYLKAAEVNHMFLPKWTLANFYFRQQKPDAFFYWSRETLAVTPYASDPVFAQMWQMSQDESLLNAAIPPKPRILLQYAWYLSNAKRYESIPPVVERLVHAVGKDDPSKWGRDDLLAAAEDHMLAAGYLKPALNIWSTLQAAGWIEQSVPNDQSPITNGAFKQRFFRHGFDWVANENTGTRVEQYSETPEVHIGLYGDEAEHITLLQQYVPVAAGASYRVSWQAEGEGLEDPSGLAWHLHALKGGNVPEVISGDLLAPNKSWDFVAPLGAKTFLVTLEYERPMGVARARGGLALKSVSMNQR